MGRLVDSRGGARLGEGGEKTRPFSANFCLRMRESAMCCFGCFLRAAGPHKSSCQVESAIRCFGCFLVAASPHKSSCQVCKGFACQRQPTDQCLPVSERTCLEEMVGDLPGALADGIGM